MISNKQAKILGGLLIYGEIRLYEEGYAFDGEDFLDGRSLLGLLKRGLIQPSGYNTMPSVGHIMSPVFYDDAVTEEGKKELKEYLDSVSYIKRINIAWMKKAYQSLNEK